jgi:8-oxo-dGTP pyrophosphatase MutT (NUDIX family)/predicted GNAT family N-acyltransferase
VILTASGHYFLPGGGMDEGETPEECLRREVLEETGCQIKIGAYIGKAQRYFISSQKEPLLSIGMFYTAELTEQIQAPVEDDHDIVWISLENVDDLLFHEHQAWAVKKAIAGPHYRRASLQDEDELFDLATRLATSFTLRRADFSKTFRHVMTDAHADLFIAEMDSKLIGYVLAYHHSTFYANGVVSWVEELFVAEACRRMNIGKKLMALVEEQAAARGSKLVALATRRAGEFYKSIGYEESAAYFKKTLPYRNEQE